LDLTPLLATATIESDDEEEEVDEATELARCWLLLSLLLRLLEVPLLVLGSLGALAVAVAVAAAMAVALIVMLMLMLV